MVAAHDSGMELFWDTGMPVIQQRDERSSSCVEAVRSDRGGLPVQDDPLVVLLQIVAAAWVAVRQNQLVAAFKLPDRGSDRSAHLPAQ